jgi:nitrogen-specific signal transduction histidine kinase
VSHGRESDARPMVVLLLAVLVPAACLLWFMGAAMRNERLAARERLTEAYAVQLAMSQTRLDEYWQQQAIELEKIAQTNTPPAAFAKCVRAGVAESVVLFDERGKVIYPDRAAGSTNAFNELQPQWAEANQSEYLRKDPMRAAKLYHELGTKATNVDLAARAFQAEARCLVQARQEESAIKLIEEIFARKRFSRATDPQGRLIAANAELMALELVKEHAAFQSLVERLKNRLIDYENPALAAPQRRFLMKELQKLSVRGVEFPTLAAEEWAAEWCEGHWSRMTDATLRPALKAGWWQFGTRDGRVLALVGSDRLMAKLHAVLARETLPAEVEFALLPPGVENDRHFRSILISERLPGWRLALSPKNPQRFDAATKYRSAIYLWSGTLVVGVMGVLTTVALRMMRRRVALARLKNGLAATVSHELKTPLASMRVLVDTLLDSPNLKEETVREYLALIADENERLSRVVQNFLSFSRIETQKHAFTFAAVPVRQIIDAAVGAMGGRLNAPGCQFEARVEAELPPMMADGDALASALTNLLDNAWKYSEDIKHIVLTVRAEDRMVMFSVKDNGIGIAPRDTKRIFQPFYQVDQRLSRKAGGCGLGLSIVQSIVAAHRGSLSVQSVPGGGSTFTMAVPAAAGVPEMANAAESG